MLRIRPRKEVQQAVDYFCHDVGLTSGERVGVWMGASPNPVRGESVEPGDFEAALRGWSPREMQPLARNLRIGKSVCAWDAVLAVDKSISVGALCLDNELAQPIEEAVEEATRDIIPVMELLAARRQRNSSACKTIQTGNLMIAAFTHERSRHEDPHLHTHAIIMNTTFDQNEGCWYALHERQIYKHQKALRLFWHRQIFQRLRAHGFRASISEGIARLPVPDPICERLSSAHNAIVAAERIAAAPGKWPARDWRNRLNDRIRPAKRAVKWHRDLREFLSREEKDSLHLRDGGSGWQVSNEGGSALLHAVEQRVRDKGRLWSTGYTFWNAAAELAQDEYSINLQDFCDALRMKQEDLAGGFVRFEMDDDAESMSFIEATRSRAHNNAVINERRARVRTLQQTPSITNSITPRISQHSVPAVYRRKS